VGKERDAFDQTSKPIQEKDLNMMEGFNLPEKL
jgi:hypothetical protein